MPDPARAGNGRASRADGTDIRAVGTATLGAGDPAIPLWTGQHRSQSLEALVKILRWVAVDATALMSLMNLPFGFEPDLSISRPLAWAISVLGAVGSSPRPGWPLRPVAVDRP